MENNSRGDRLFQWTINILTLLIGIVTLYPLIYVLSASISAPKHILSGKVWLWPVDITFSAYERVFSSGNIVTGYRNTILYATFGTLLNVILTIMAAYPLSIKDMKGRNVITFMITFTMFFSGGMIPSLMRKIYGICLSATTTADSRNASNVLNWRKREFSNGRG